MRANWLCGAILGLSCCRASLAQTTPTVRCSELRALSNYSVTITSAIEVPASPAVPSHCRVTGQILPEIGFETNLPIYWNGRLYMFGNGGFGGESFDAPARATVRAKALVLGFATAATDTGHRVDREPLASFAADRQKLLDFAFRSLHVTAATAKALIQSYYGKAPSESYFEGCSTGGRQALILAQRFPTDFDGLVVGAPVLDMTGTVVSLARIAQTLERSPVPATKLPALAKIIYDSCDGKDGLRDGLIEDPRRCGFDPARALPHCGSNSEEATCFTESEIASLTTIYSDFLGDGLRILKGWPVGSEIADATGRSGWDPWMVRSAGRSTDSIFAESFFRYMASPIPDPLFDITHFELRRDLSRLEWVHSILDATDPDLSAFHRHGGKILMYAGWADPAINPLADVSYYEGVVGVMGREAPNFIRLFLVPGMFHCGGGVGTDSFDRLHPLIEWVEHGAAPSRIVAQRILGGKVVRTRPLCAYPEVARYRGSGSIDDEASFVCGNF
jgi:Tannase and feruloyl esterase